MANYANENSMVLERKKTKQLALPGLIVLAIVYLLLGAWPFWWFKEQVAFSPHRFVEEWSKLWVQSGVLVVVGWSLAKALEAVQHTRDERSLEDQIKRRALEWLTAFRSLRTFPDTKPPEAVFLLLELLRQQQEGAEATRLLSDKDRERFLRLLDGFSTLTAKENAEFFDITDNLLRFFSKD